jgi:hypothetical protein
MTQHFFMFSAGSYSDYGVNGLYVCDHEVTKAEWTAHYKVFQAESERRYQEHRKAHPLAGTAASRAAALELAIWRKENNPEESFQKLHNMQPVEVTELWRD